ncbi:MAG TPA: GGDEF domain-containing protein, partial [Anaerolineae bacterium]|nr:GGDEF domain-containing protein [Anaerolineae bacterium]
NSRSFYSQLELEVDRFNRYGHPLALLLLDVDYFKQYNDAYGHLEGDKVLVRFSQIIKSCLRANDSAYRYGGEEFTVILSETGAEGCRPYRVQPAFDFGPSLRSGPPLRPRWGWCPLRALSGGGEAAAV